MTFTPKTLAFGIIAAVTLIISLQIASVLRRSRSPIPSKADQTRLVTNTQPSGGFDSKENTGGNVTVIVTPKVLTPKKQVVFEVAYETHSVELDFDAASISSLIDSEDTDYGSPSWEGSPPGGHHRKGTLTFTKPLSGNARSITLTLTNVAGIPSRTLTWEVKR